MEDESEINLDRVEEEMIAAYSDDSDEENIFRLDDLKPRKREITASELKSNIDEGFVTTSINAQSKNINVLSRQSF